MRIVKTAGVNVQLTKEEAEALISVLAMIGGDPNTSRRRHTDAIYVGLSEAGFRYDTKDIAGNLSFEG